MIVRIQLLDTASATMVNERCVMSLKTLWQCFVLVWLCEERSRTRGYIHATVHRLGLRRENSFVGESVPVPTVFFLQARDTSVMRNNVLPQQKFPE